jgi:hypothetical protein
MLNIIVVSIMVNLSGSVLVSFKVLKKISSSSIVIEVYYY